MAVYFPHTLHSTPEQASISQNIVYLCGKLAEKMMLPALPASRRRNTIGLRRRATGQSIKIFLETYHSAPDGASNGIMNRRASSQYMARQAQSAFYAYSEACQEKWMPADPS
jgi:hypothetical protein